MGEGALRSRAETLAFRTAALQEHAGNDPNTQLVPSGGGGSGWSKPEEPAPAPAPEIKQPALTAGSTWASSAGPRPPAAGWGGPGPLPPGERRLNPEEYPSLAAATSGAAQKPKPGYDQPQVRTRCPAPRAAARTCMYVALDTTDTAICLRAGRRAMGRRRARSAPGLPTGRRRMVRGGHSAREGAGGATSVTTMPTALLALLAGARAWLPTCPWRSACPSRPAPPSLEGALPSLSPRIPCPSRTCSPCQVRARTVRRRPLLQ